MKIQIALAVESQMAAGFGPGVAVAIFTRRPPVSRLMRQPLTRNRTRGSIPGHGCPRLTDSSPERLTDAGEVRPSMTWSLDLGDYRTVRRLKVDERA
jgi:hypothetical protein